MDSTNPFCNSQSYMDLLSSQQQHQYYEQPLTPSMVHGSSEVPLVSSDCTDDPWEAEATPQEKRERRKWTPKDDIVLISAWLNTSKDAVVGTDQKATTFWKRIAEYYGASRKVVGLQKREPTHCKQRWQKINDQVCKFVGSYEAAKAQKISGWNDKDILKRAHEIFYNDYKKKFNLEHAWIELQNDQKWCISTNRDSGPSKRRKCQEGGAQGEDGAGQSSSSHTVRNIDDQTRPLGVKAAKSNCKRTMSKPTSVESSLSMFESMWEIRKKDLEIRQDLSNKNLVQSLINKPEPLSDEERALKKLLIMQMLSEV